MADINGREAVKSEIPAHLKIEAVGLRIVVIRVVEGAVADEDIAGDVQALVPAHLRGEEGILYSEIGYGRPGEEHRPVGACGVYDHAARARRHPIVPVRG